MSNSTAANCSRTVKKFMCESNIRSKRGWRNEKAAILCIVVIPIIVSQTYGCIFLVEKYTEYSEIQKFKSQLKSSRKASALVDALQVERGYTAMYLGAVDNRKNIRRRMERRRERTNRIYEKCVQNDSIEKPESPKIAEAFANITELRLKIVYGQISVDEILDAYTEAINKIIRAKITALPETATIPGVWKRLAVTLLFQSGKDAAGLVRALGSVYYVHKNLSQRQHRAFAENWTKQETLFKLYEHYATKEMIRDERTQLLANTLTIERMRQTIDNNRPRAACVECGREWFDQISTVMNVKTEIYKRHVTDTVEKWLADHDEKLETNLITAIVALVLTVLVPPVLLFYVVRLMKTIQDFFAELVVRTKRAEKDQRNTNRLLKELLPKQMIDSLKLGEIPPPKQFDEVTLLFSNIVEFATICSKIRPSDAVELLNRIYKEFDDRIEIYEVLKCDTIGDGYSYMVASGVPMVTDSHCEEIALLALDLLRCLKKVRVPLPISSAELRLRIGVHTGPVIAAIVGYKLRRYCLFGDTVLTASRMESTGEELKIQVSERTHDRLMNQVPARFSFTRRHEIQIKSEGNGNMTTYWLEGKIRKAFLVIDKMRKTSSETSERSDANIL